MNKWLPAEGKEPFDLNEAWHASNRLRSSTMVCPINCAHWVRRALARAPADCGSAPSAAPLRLELLNARISLALPPGVGLLDSVCET